jgi:8-oxo-dGTP pyrophosphatase MutT (NUDIX family)
MALEIPSQEELETASPTEIAKYVGPGLERLPVGRLAPEVFVPIRRLVLMSTIEVVAFEEGSEGERVLIGQRGADPGDKWWAGMLNLPGSVILPNEELEPIELFMNDGRPVDIGQAVVSRDLTTPTDRILRTEFCDSVSRTTPVTELMRRWVNSESGTENKTWVWTEVGLTEGHEGIRDGDFYDTQEIIDDPPSNLVRGHHYFVEQGRLALHAVLAE